jgi:hypothetical protein
MPWRCLTKKQFQQGPTRRAGQARAAGAESADLLRAPSLTLPRDSAFWAVRGAPAGRTSCAPAIPERWGPADASTNVGGDDDDSDD